jgi:hypothetical protein
MDVVLAQQLARRQPCRVETLLWIDWFNTEHPHEYLDDLSPPQAEPLHDESAGLDKSQATHETESLDAWRSQSVKT